ncbi:MAG: sigma-70 family RNA polymerase sigma factor [Vampirovibrionales bacterium]|nr:sigma-70 family RNA polymerase sigma factor [Vampirovibrionales bacterium]
MTFKTRAIFEIHRVYKPSSLKVIASPIEIVYFQEGYSKCRLEPYLMSQDHYLALMSPPPRKTTPNVTRNFRVNCLSDGKTPILTKEQLRSAYRATKSSLNDKANLKALNVALLLEAQKGVQIWTTLQESGFKTGLTPNKTRIKVQPKGVRIKFLPFAPALDIRRSIHHPDTQATGVQLAKILEQALKPEREEDRLAIYQLPMEEKVALVKAMLAQQRFVGDNFEPLARLTLGKKYPVLAREYNPKNDDFRQGLIAQLFPVFLRSVWSFDPAQIGNTFDSGYFVRAMTQALPRIIQGNQMVIPSKGKTISMLSLDAPISNQSTGSSSLLETIAGNSESPLAAVERNITNAKLQRALETLPPEQAALLRQVYVQGLPYEQIASSAPNKKTRQAVSQQVQSALNALRVAYSSQARLS